ncbi:MAG: ParA family protein [Corynebacterium sp.]|nr:ParA family protein [Corynebacterium sp.]
MENQWPDTPIANAAKQAAAIRERNVKPFPKPATTRIITVANQKGGVGKTTSTVNLAAGLALGGMKVLAIDLDPQGNASTALGAPHTSGTNSIYEVLIGEIPLAMATVTSTFSENLEVVPATLDLAGAEIELVSMVRREYRLHDALLGAVGAYDYVIIDCPPSLGLLTINAMTAAHEVLLPIQCEYYALEGVSQLLNNIQMIHDNLNDTLTISAILLTMYDRRTNLSNEVAEEVRGHFGDAVLTTVIPRNVRVSEAPSYGQTVLDYDPGSPGAAAYMAAARELAEKGA